MKDKIFELLKTKYSPLGFSDNAFNELSDKLAASGKVTDENLTDVVESAGLYLAPLQSELDRRVGSVTSKSQKELNATAKSLGWDSWEDMAKGAKKTTQNNDQSPAPLSVSIPKELQDKIAELDKKYAELSEREATQKAKEASAKFSADVKANLLKKEIGCADDVFLKLVLHEIDNSRSIDDNVTLLKKRYDEEASSATQAGYYVPQSQTITVAAIDPSKRDAEEREFAKKMQNSNKQI